MADVTIKIDIDAKTTAIERVRAQLAALSAQADQVNRSFADFDDRSKKLNSGLVDLDKELKNKKKDFDALEKEVKKNDSAFNKFNKTSDKSKGGLKKFGSALNGLAKFLQKVFLINLLASAAALVAINLAFKAGSAIAKGYKAAVSGVFQMFTAGAAVALTALSTFLAGQREFLAAQQATKYGGGVQGLERASVAMRGLSSNTKLAVLGSEALQGAFAALSQNGKPTAQMQSALQAMGDFAAASGDPKKTFAAAAGFLSQLQEKGKVTSDIVAAAKEIGPEFEKAVKDAKKKGITSSGAFMNALAGGDLSGAVAGQLDLVGETLFGSAKRYFGIIKTMFADFGTPMLKPAKEALQEIAFIFQRTFMSISGGVRDFAGGDMLGGVVDAFDRAGHWISKIFEEYLPKSEGLFGRIGDFFDKIKEGFDKVKEVLRPLTEGGQVLIDTFKPLIKEIFGSFGNGVQEFNQLVIANKDDFMEFGQSLVKLFKEFARLFGYFKKAIVDVLPVITKLVDVVSAAVSGLTSFFGMLSGGLGSIGSALALGAWAGKGAIAKGIVGAGPAGGDMGFFKGMKSDWSAARGAAPGSRWGSFAKSGTGRMMSGVGTAVGVATVMGSESATGGALGGGLAGLSMGAQFGPIGAGVGLVAGALVGGIVGHLKKAAKNRGEVKQAASDYAKSLTTAADEGLAGGSALQAEAALANIEATSKKISKIVTENNLSGSGTDTDTVVNRLLAEGTLTDAEAEQLRKAPITYMNALKEQDKQLRRNLNPRLEKYNSNAKRLSEITGKSEEEIRSLADTFDVDLSDGLLKVKEIVGQLTDMVVYGTSAEMRAAFSDAYAGALLEAFQKPGQVRESLAAITEQERYLYDQAKAGGPIAPGDIEQYLLMAGQLDLAQGLTPAESLSKMTRSLTQQSVFFGPGGPFEGMGETLIPAFRQAIGPAIQSFTTSPEFTSGAATFISGVEEFGVGGISAPQLQAAFQKRLAGLTDPVEKAAFIEQYMSKMEQILDAGSISDVAGTSVSGLTPYETAIAEADALSGVFQDMGIDVEFGVGGIQGALLANQDAMNDYTAYIRGLIESDVFVPRGGVGGTPIYQTDPKTGVVSLVGYDMDGDGKADDTTSSRLASTIGKHRRFDSMLPGKRSITSSYRTTNLGSLNSDHLTGNAYDLVGQNLVGYSQMVRQSGGFAEFHGGLSDRHLHVVPGDGPAGDTMAPVASLSPVSGASGSTISNSYQFTIHAAEGASPREIANEVMERIYREQRSARERQ